MTDEEFDGNVLKSMIEEIARLRRAEQRAIETGRAEAVAAYQRGHATGRAEGWTAGFSAGEYVSVRRILGYEDKEG